MCYFPSYLLKRVSCFVFDNVMTFEYLKIKNLISYLKNKKSLQSEIKIKCSLLDIQNKLAKM